MIKRTFSLTTAFAIAVLTTALTSINTWATDGPKLSISAIPYSLELGSQPNEAKTVNNVLSLSAFKGSDLFVGTDASNLADTAPRVLFEPKGDFIFSAKVAADFKGLYDGGALVVYSDAAHWAKFLFESAKPGEFSVTSTVARPESDNSQHSVEKAKSVYLKIAYAKNMYVLYTSQDGATWHYVRHFSLKTTAPVKIGFSAQSPVGDKFTATFSEIKYREATFKDFWQGE